MDANPFPHSSLRFAQPRKTWRSGPWVLITRLQGTDFFHLPFGVAIARRERTRKAQVENQPVRKISFVKGFPRWGWIVGGGVYLDDLETVTAAEAKRILSCGLILTLLISLAAIILTRSVSTDLRRAVNVAHRLAQGDMTVLVEERS